jgi:hypothetical protein
MVFLNGEVEVSQGEGTGLIVFLVIFLQEYILLIVVFLNFKIREKMLGFGGGFLGFSAGVRVCGQLG